MTLRSPYLEAACAIGPQIGFYTSNLLRPAFLAEDKKKLKPTFALCFYFQTSPFQENSRFLANDQNFIKLKKSMHVSGSEPNISSVLRILIIDKVFTYWSTCWRKHHQKWRKCGEELHYASCHGTSWRNAGCIRGSACRGWWQRRKGRNRSARWKLNQSPFLDESLDQKQVQKLRVRPVRRMAGTGISGQTSDFCIPVPRAVHAKRVLSLKRRPFCSGFCRSTVSEPCPKGAGCNPLRVSLQGRFYWWGCNG